MRLKPGHIGMGSFTILSSLTATAVTITARSTAATEAGRERLQASEG